MTRMDYLVHKVHKTQKPFGSYNPKKLKSANTEKNTTISSQLLVLIRNKFSIYYTCTVNNNNYL